MKINLCVFYTVLIQILSIIKLSKAFLFEDENFHDRNFLELDSELKLTSSDPFRIKTYVISEADKATDKIKEKSSEVIFGKEDLQVINKGKVTKNITYYE